LVVASTDAETLERLYYAMGDLCRRPTRREDACARRRRSSASPLDVDKLRVGFALLTRQG